MIPTQTLHRFILAEEKNHPGASGELSDLLTSIALGMKMISRLVATAGFKGLHGYTGNVNVQGERTHKLDDEADQILVELLSSSGHFGSLVSEERDDVINTEVQGKDAKYVVAFDPLDGSSNIGTNIPVGTIFTIFRSRGDAGSSGLNDFLQPGRESIVAAGYSVYGAKTTFVYSCGKGVHDFTLDPTIGEFVLTQENVQMPEQGSTYSVNEGYWGRWSEKTIGVINGLKMGDSPLGKSYSARYVGSLVADFDRTLRKGGVFLHPANESRARGKLRLLYECLPLSFIVEQAGGRAIDGEQNVLDITPSDIHERCPFIVGSKKEVDWIEGALK